MISTKPRVQKFQGSTTFQGFYLRQNINGTNALPVPAPYDLCPDIIQSIAALSNPANTLASSSAWANTYNVAPAIGQENYFYVRGMNGTQIPVNSQISLYYAPAQLILLPETWENNILSTAGGQSTVAVKAGAGSVAVTADPFVWPATPAPATGSDFYSFVAQVNNAADGNPVPTIDSWLDMSELLTQNLGFGFRNTCQVESNATTWAHQFMLNIPDTITDPSTLQVVISTAGMNGNTFSLKSNDTGNLINFLPFTASGNSSFTSMNVVPPTTGYSASLTLGYENNAGTFPAQGAAVTVSINYLVPDTEIHEAGMRGLLQPGLSKVMSSNDAGMPVQQFALIGSITFVVA